LTTLTGSALLKDQPSESLEGIPDWVSNYEWKAQVTAWLCL